MTETQERFLRAIAPHVPIERVAELHLFPSLRQGPLESGVAVIAVTAVSAPAAEPVEDASAASAREPAAATEDAAPPAGDEFGEAAAPVAVDPGADAVDAAASAEDEAHGDAEDDHSTDADVAPAAAGVDRLTIYSAHYRLTIKGPDRGKWELAVHAEADAPLVTLEAVVRGVRHRAGDHADTERLSGDEFRAVLSGAPAWTATR